jgi:phosphoenolpyruvate carboxylase
MSSNFNNLVGTRYHIYNSLFLNLPFASIHHTGTLLPLFQKYCEAGFAKGNSAEEIVKDFFNDFIQQANADERLDLLFKFIQYVERQVALFDSVEDSAFEQINDLGGKGSIKALLMQVRQEGREDELKKKIEEFSLRLVLTAHPTQFYPGPVLGILTDLERAIREHNLEHINLLLKQLGKTAFINKEKPSPYDEAVSLCWFLENVFYESIGSIAVQLQSSLNVSLDNFANKRLIAIGFWPGGDRDGNPFVTSPITLRVADRLREGILKCYHRDLRILRRRLTFQGVDRMIFDVEQAIYSMAFAGGSYYKSPDQLIEALLNIRKKLINEHDGLFLDLLDAFIVKVKLFGFYFASLDIRQDSRRHTAAWSALFDQLYKQSVTSNASTFESLSEEERINYLLSLDFSLTDLVVEDEFAQETVNSVKTLRQIQENNGEAGCHRYVISNCQKAQDVIAVFTLVRLAFKQAIVPVDVVPLFETIDDLKHAGDIMEQLYQIPAYREQLKYRGNKQDIMLGFSDGTKDGGYLRANWSIFRAKEALTTISRKYGINVIFFDGRGGPPARGGGNTHDFYASLGDTIEQKEVQITIQGQTINSNFGRLPSCKFNIEQLLSAGLQGSLIEKKNQLTDEDKTLIDDLANEGYKAYLSLKQHEKFVPYLENKTPLTFFGDTNIGSRPVKRNGSDGLKLEDLRAIPFVGAWAMMKQNIPGFYGVGSAIQVLKEKGKAETLQTLYQRSLFFRTLIGNSMMSLTKSYYQATTYLDKDAEYGAFWNKMHDEFLLARKNVLEVSGLNELLENNPSIRDSVKLRETIVLPLIAIQQFALMRLAKLAETDKGMELRYRKLIIRCMFGIINAARNSA